MYSLLIVIVIPFTVAQIIKFIFNKDLKEKVTELFPDLEIWFLALAIAINSFPGHELISIALVIGPLIELPVLYIVSKFCLWIKNSELYHEN